MVNEWKYLLVLEVKVFKEITTDLSLFNKNYFTVTFAGCVESCVRVMSDIFLFRLLLWIKYDIKLRVLGWYNFVFAKNTRIVLVYIKNSEVKK